MNIEGSILNLPAVNPADLKSFWTLKKGAPTPEVWASAFPKGGQGDEKARSVWGRAAFLSRKEKHGLLEEWKRDSQLDDIVVRVMAEVPLEPLSGER